MLLCLRHDGSKLAALAPLAALAGCATQRPARIGHAVLAPSSPATTVTSTLKETTAPVETTSTGMLVPEALAGAVRQPSSVAPAPAQQEDEAVIGYSEAPDQKKPQVMEKQIASCGDPSIHETGTTFFTAGRSGCTANCAAQIM